MQSYDARMKHRGGFAQAGCCPRQRRRAAAVIGTPVTAEGTELGPLIAASGTQGLALLRLDRLTEAGAIPRGEVPLTVGWPAWLPR